MLGREQRRYALQGSAGIVAHHDVFAYLNKVGQVRGNVQALGSFASGRTVGQKLDAHGLADPVRAGFEVVEKDLVQGLLAVQHGFQRGLAIAEALPYAVLQKLQDQIALRVHTGVKISDIGAQGVALRQSGGQLLIKARGGDAQRQNARLVVVAGKAHEHAQLRFIAQRKRQVVQIIEQGKGFLLREVAPDIKREQHTEQLGLVLLGRIAEKALHHELERVADPGFLRGDQQRVGADKAL